MSSFRNHRVIIASLFLPSTVVVGESEPTTPARSPDTGDSLIDALGAIAQRLAKEPGKPLKSALSNKGISITPSHNSHSRSASANVPLKSIVDDLKDKVRIFIRYLITLS